MKFESNNILLNVTANDQKEVLSLIANNAEKFGYTNDANALKEDFINREKEFSTGFGNGVAIPHAKSNDVKEATVFFVRLNNGIDWNSMDDKPVKDIIAIMVPANASKEHLDILAKLSRQIIHSEFIDKLNQGNQEEIFNLISKTIS